MTPGRPSRPSGGSTPKRATRKKGSSSARRGKPNGPEPIPAPPEYLKRLGVHPRKALGQNFLVDDFLLTDIAAAAVRNRSVPVIEIGAGPGGLTEELVKRADTVVAIEIDEDLSALTRARLAEYPGLHVLAADFMEFEPVELLEESGAPGPLVPYVAVGNLPYYITQPIIRKLLECAVPPDRIVVLVQREVAHRMVGGPGKESLLSISIKMYGEPRFLFDVPREAFWPPPKVQSAVVEIERFPRPALDLTRGEITAFFHLVRAGFAQPRKQLHNSLVDESGLPRDQVLAMIEACGIDPVARPQHLSLKDWGRLFQEFMARFPGELDVVETDEVDGPPDLSEFDVSEDDEADEDEGDDHDDRDALDGE
jgi:16S rRNA (adenine1518-N6/adenine1519-N6)-dimethyltransferase